MSTADDLRDLRDALDSIAHGALPRWFKPTTKTGEEAQLALREVYQKYIRALQHESSAEHAVAQARVQVDDYRSLAEVLTARCEAAEAEIERVRAEWQRDLDGCNTIIDRLKARLGDK